MAGAALTALLVAMWIESRKKVRAERAKLAALVAQAEHDLVIRAEEQNDAYLRGEPYGMYGDFPPVQWAGAEDNDGREGSSPMARKRDMLGRFAS